MKRNSKIILKRLAKMKKYNEIMEKAVNKYLTNYSRKKVESVTI